MTIRTEHVDVTKTVEADIPICDGCGIEVDLDTDKSTEWVPDTSNRDPVHTCETCDIQTLTRGAGAQASLRARVRAKRLSPMSPAAVLLSLLMAALTGSIVVSDAISNPDSMGTALFIMGFLSIIAIGASLDMAEDGQDISASVLALIPLGGLLGLFGTTGPYAAWATLIGATWMIPAYIGYFYRFGDGD